MPLTINHSRGSYSIGYQHKPRLISLPESTVLVSDRYFESAIFRLFDIKSDNILFLCPSEQIKTLATVEKLINFLSSRSQHIDHVIALGGGVIQDITAFTCSIYRRGIPWTYFPTTLLSQGDSCLGSKSSINFPGVKNLIGSYYPPSQIFLITEFLSTLPCIEILSGVGDMLHYALIPRSVPLNLLSIDWLHFASLEPTRQLAVIRSIHEIKKEFIEKDEFDQSARRLLNFGHTFGHALEISSGFSLPHGICVIYGMAVACYFAARQANQAHLPDQSRLLLGEALSISSEYLLRTTYDPTLFLIALKRDKKNRSTESLTAILPASSNYSPYNVAITTIPYSSIIPNLSDVLNPKFILEWYSSSLMASCNA